MKASTRFWQVLKWLGLTIGAYLIWGILDAARQGKNVWVTLALLASKILHMKTPDVFFLVSLIILVLLIIAPSKRFQGLSIERFKEMLADNQRMQRHNEQLIKDANELMNAYKPLSLEINQLKTGVEKILEEKANKPEEPKPDEEIINLLCLLADRPNRTLELRYIKNDYRKFPGKTMKDLQMLLNELATHGLIYETEYGDLGEIAFVITSAGLAYLKKHKD